MKERIAILEGIRTPLGKMGGAFKDYSPDNLGALVLRELLTRHPEYHDLIEEVIAGNVAQPAESMNIARVIALRAGVKQSVPAFTVHRNCASGFEALTSSAARILSGNNQVIAAVASESMSNIPFFFHKSYKEFLEQLMRARSLSERLKVITKFRLRMLKPEIGLKHGLTDPTNGMIMGDTAELLARDFGITRAMQDEFALTSHVKASRAIENNEFADEVLPVIYNAKAEKYLENDEGVRPGQNMKDLTKLKPYFDRINGTVTAGNSSQITDGAAAVFLASESYAKEHNLKPLGYIRDYAYSGCDPKRMGIGPVHATQKLLVRNKVTLKDFDLIEINEAFAAQVLGCVAAFDSDKYAKDHFGLDSKIGEIDMDKLNINGGAIAVGHPVGVTGLRIVLHLLHQMRRKQKATALATLCIGGGQGGSIFLESE
ncbi:MAG: thiolase family protein [Rickettsiales bacterium]|jgi:acetyl-CoA acetyltransferase family protein|nr:thiolase family protein [Rickettsiales bacterium]